MAYTPTNWVSGDVVTAQKMNKLEQGVAQGGNCRCLNSDGHLDRSYNDIAAMVEESGVVPFLVDTGRMYVLSRYWLESGTYTALFKFQSDNAYFIASDPDELMVFDD